MKLSARLDRALARARFASNRYLVLEMVAPARQRTRSRQPLNVALVLDRSGSIAGEKLALARDVVVEVHAPGAEVELLNDYVAEPLPDGVRARLGDLGTREHKSLALRLTTRPAAAGAEVPVEAVLMYREPDDGRGRELRFPAIALRHAADPEVDAQPRDFAATKEVGLIYAARAKKGATLLNRQGRYDEARRILERTAERIAGYAGSDPELCEAVRQLRDLAREAAAPMSAMAMKEATYASYLLARKGRDYQ